jgi:hypothetical protein
MAMRGFSTLTTPKELLRKLEREYARLQADPTDVDCAWNFFVTAEHLPDWVSRGESRLPTGETLKVFKQGHRLKHGHDLLYLFGELSRLANRLRTQLTATATRDSEHEVFYWVHPSGEILP